ncbi:arginine deiminase-related protein, partial [Vibrio parahaemolyticus]
AFIKRKIDSLLKTTSVFILVNCQKISTGMQNTDKLLMIRPANFFFNPQTAVNNRFQVAATDQQTAQNAAKEFDDFVQLLTTKGIDVTVIQDSSEPQTPDSIFPNNWIS